MNKNKWRLAVKTLPLVLIVVLFKYIYHFLDIEFLSLNALFTAIISANIFLIGFLISGTLSDFKESERLPAEIASSLQVLSDESYIVYLNKKSPDSIEILNKVSSLNNKIISWFYKKVKTEESLVEEVSLKPVIDSEKRINKLLSEIGSR